MWEAYAVGTIPVGAVVCDDGGEVVSRGRNRILDPEVHETQLGRTRLAHAEINALLELEAARTYESFTLYTALEPCHLCLAARIPRGWGGSGSPARTRTAAPSESSSRAPTTWRTRSRWKARCRAQRVSSRSSSTSRISFGAFRTGT